MYVINPAQGADTHDFPDVGPLLESVQETGAIVKSPLKSIVKLSNLCQL